MPSLRDELLAEIAREEARLAELARQHEAARSQMAALRAKLATLSPEEPIHSALPVAAVPPSLTTPAAKARLFRALFRGRENISRRGSSARRPRRQGPHPHRGSAAPAQHPQLSALPGRRLTRSRRSPAPCRCSEFWYDEGGILPSLIQQGELVNKKKLKKPMFLMKETLVDLTPYLQGQVQGGDDLCGTITNWQLPRPTLKTMSSCYACN